jgi:hypothetical protein
VRVQFISSEPVVCRRSHHSLDRQGKQRARHQTTTMPGQPLYPVSSPAAAQPPPPPLPPALPRPLGPPPVPPPAHGGGGWNTGVIVGLSLGGGGAVLGALALLAVWCWKRWARQPADAALVQAGPRAPRSAPPPPRPPPQAHPLPRPPASASGARRQQ